MLSASIYFCTLAPAAELFLIGLVVVLRQCLALRLGQEGGCGGLDLKGFADRGAGRGIVDDRLQQRLHPRRLDIAPDLGDLGAIGTEHDGRRPAPVAVAAGEIRIGVLVDAHRQIFLREQRLHLGVGVGGLFHHVAPVAPHRLEIEDDEALLGGRAREQVVVPVAPFQVVGERRRRRERGKGDGGNTKKLHGIPRQAQMSERATGCARSRLRCGRDVTGK